MRFYEIQCERVIWLFSSLYRQENVGENHKIFSQRIKLIVIVLSIYNTTHSTKGIMTCIF